MMKVSDLIVITHPFGNGSQLAAAYILRDWRLMVSRFMMI